MSDFRDVDGSIFSTRSSGTDGQLTVHLIGCLDMETVSLLKVLLDELDLEIVRGRISEVVFGTEELYLLSSASISCFATWIKGLTLKHPQCSVTFRTNPNLSWQRRSFEPIRLLAERRVAVV